MDLRRWKDRLANQESAKQRTKSGVEIMVALPVYSQHRLWLIPILYRINLSCCNTDLLIQWPAEERSFSLSLSLMKQS